MKVDLLCKKRKLDGSYERFSKWDIKGVYDRDCLSKEQKHQLSLVHKYGKLETDRNERMFYVCTCNKYRNIELSIVHQNQKYFLRNMDGKLHEDNCPFFRLQKHYNEDGTQIALSDSMLKLPKDNPEKEAENTKVSTSSNVVARVNKKRITTFNGLMYSILDSANISMNHQNNFNQTNLCNQILGRFLNMPFGIKDAIPFSEYRKKIEKGNSISFDVGFIREKCLQLRKLHWDNGTDKLTGVVDENSNYVNHVLDANFLENIKSQKYELVNKFEVYDKGEFKSARTPLIPPLVMRATLNSIRNYNNFTQGPYLYFKLSTKLTKKEKYKSNVQFFVQPIYLSQKYIFPVESNFERICIKYIEENHQDIRLYKPMTLDRELFFENLLKFLIEYPGYMDIYKQACDNYDDKTVIRPDLFTIKDDILYIFEFAGYTRDEFYMSRLKEKREKFYSYFDKFDNIKYVEIKSDTAEKDFNDNGL